MTHWLTGSHETDGVTLSFTRTGGAKPPLVMLHGLTHGGRTWIPWARELSADFDVVMPDARGHGGSSTPATGYTYDALASDVVALIRGLALESPVLLGHSMGGMTAAVVAARQPSLLRGLVLADPTFLGPDVQQDVYAGGAAVEQHRRLLATPLPEVVADLRARHPHRTPEIVELIAQARRATGLPPFEILAPPNPDFRQLIRAIRVPALLVIGGPGGVVSREVAAELQELHAGLQVAQLAGAGHGLHLDQPERFLAVVQGFLDELRTM